MLEASAFQALQVWAPYRGRNKPPVELVVRDLVLQRQYFNVSGLILVPNDLGTLETLSKGHTFPLVSQRLPGRMTFITGNPQMLYTPAQKHTAMYYFGQGLTATAGHAL